jgi:hypothetical protein
MIKIIYSFYVLIIDKYDRTARVELGFMISGLRPRVGGGSKRGGGGYIKVEPSCV